MAPPEEGCLDRVEQLLIPVLGAALLGHALSNAPLRFDPPDPRPFDVATFNATLLAAEMPALPVASSRPAWSGNDPYDCFCGAN
ncbi:hypothetical protein ABAZ39_20000 (plasmid) [Azospirillum argentinense]|uniref:Uncharacterized protein n=1 Tax=Azospirillum argentinense TaxID=2970906 RepID=A0A060DJE6_9PROT|nr:hypothetical protein ABAZ39_20000 [Azospirillum argentinense]EZQ06473.1 hypothetical protein ABAZ39_18100 [Azospirillum argentinense]